MARWLSGFAFVMAFVLLTPEAFACSCVGMSPCSHLELSDAVFTGRVTSIDEKFQEGEVLGKKQRVRVGLIAHLEISHLYKGLRKDQRTVDVTTGGGGGDCGYGFQAGKEYFVMGNQARGAVGTSICSGTRPLEEAQDRIELVEAVLRGRPETRIYGTVVLEPSEFGRRPGEYGPSKPLGGIRVEARGAGGAFFDVSDSNGRFRMRNLPEGKYVVQPILPPTHSGYLGLDEKKNVEITLPRNCAAEMYVMTQINGVIRGRLYDSTGKPVGANVEVSLLSSEDVNKPRADIVGDSDWTEKDGTFEFNGLMPGRYIVGVGILHPPNWRSPYADIYYPGVSAASQSQVLTLTEGQKLENIDFHLPPSAPTMRLRGLVLDKSGSPVGKDIHIEVFDLKSGRVVDTPEGFSPDGIGPNGTFSLTVPTGRQYRVRAIKGYYGDDALQSDAVTITANDRLTPITFRVTKPFRESEDAAR